MKKHFILALVLLKSGFLFSQSYQINWEEPKQYAFTNGKTKLIPFFNNPINYVLNEYDIPRFEITFDGSVPDISIENLKLVPLNTTELSNFNAYEIIDNKVKYSIQPFYSTNQEKTLVSIIPYLIKENKVFKIESFSIVKKQGLKQSKLFYRSENDVNTSLFHSGSWFKIKVDKTGVFKLDKRFFTNNGIPTSGYNSSTLKIYGNGNGRLLENIGEFRYSSLQEIPITFKGSEDNSFDNDDYIAFYAKGPHQWYRTRTSSLPDIFLRFNTYDDYSYYFITFEGQNGKRIEEVSLSGVPTREFDTYEEYKFHKSDSININQVGRQWVGNLLNGSNRFTKQFNLGAPITTSPGYLSYSLVGKNGLNTTASIQINGNEVVSESFNSSSFNNKSGQVPFPITSNQANVTVNYLNSANPSGLAFVNYLELKYQEQLKYQNQQFNFRKLEDLNTGLTYGFKLSDNTNVKVWNVSDISAVYQIVPEGSVYLYNSNSEIFQNEFVAFKDDHLYTDAKFVGRVNNQNIRSFDDVSLVIVTHPSLKDQALRLGQFRQQYNNIKVAVVTTEEVYNEFSSGSKDPIAIRDYFKFLKDKGNPLEYAILFGATSYDPKDRIQGNINLIPSFYNLNSESLDSSITTDDYFAMLGDYVIFAEDQGNGNYSYNANYLDIAIGRIPASSRTEAKTFVDKIISYYQKIDNKGNSYGDWRTKIVAVSDDPDADDLDVNTPKYDTDIDQIFNQSQNKFYAVNKLYLDAYEPEQTSAGLRYPSINRAIVNNIELGTNFMMYYGHGGPRSWAQERILTGEELMNLSNFTSTYSRLPIVATITCDFTVWDLPQYESAGEMMLRNPNGGALSMLTTNRPIGTMYGSSFNSYLLRELFRLENHQNLSTGKALLRAKKAYNATSSDHSRVSLLGDPMVAISRPRQDISISTFKVNGVEVDLNSYQIKALDFIEIEGNVLKNSNGLDESFNGNIQNILYEKPIKKSLRNNKGFGNFTPYTFTEEFNTIYKGTSKVENGHFTIKYYIPKDINYEVGERKLVLYAYSETSDAVVDKQVIVGGLNENGLNDNEIPQGKLYMNNLNFANGGITDRDPYLVACLTDNTGINATGASIGHDIVATLDGKVQDAYILNDYYESGDGNPCVNKNFEAYQKGQVIYQLKNLELGNHQVQVKFWDINNNSNTASLDFIVMESGSNQLHIDKLLNWPNPFTNNTFFHFEHNCDSELDVMVQIFTVSGKLVKTIRQTISSEPFREGYRTGKYAIEWDGLDDFGDKIGKGTYIYKATVKGVNQELCNGSASAIERLVILK